MKLVSFLLNYEAMLTDCSPAAANNKGKQAIGLPELTNQSGSCSSIPNRVEDMHLSPLFMPTEDTAVINVDAAYKPLTGDSAIGAVVRDRQGSIIAAISRTVDRCQDAEEAEARAILAGLQLGIELGLHQPILMSDCTAAVNATRSPVPNLSKLWSVYKEISVVALRLPGCVVQYTSRKFNSFAHNLAQLAFRSGTCNFWLAPIPAVISELAVGDGVNFESE